MCRRTKPLKKCRVIGSSAIMLISDVDIRQNRASVMPLASANSAWQGFAVHGPARPGCGHPSATEGKHAMIRQWPTVLALLAGLCLGAAWEGRGPGARNEAKGGPPTDPAIAALQVDIQAIKDRLPDQAHAMQDVANQFSNVWFAEAKRHWELTNFYLGETRSHLRWAVRIIAKRKDAAGKD